MFLPKSDIEKLKLGSCRLHDKEAIALAKALETSKVTSLDISGNYFGKKGFDALSKSLPESKIEELDLALNWVKLEKESLDKFKRALIESNVKSLSIGFNDIGLDDDGFKYSNMGQDIAKAMSEVIKAGKLEELNLRCFRSIKILGAKYIGDSIARSELKKLIFNSNAIGDQGLSYTLQSLPDSKLVELDLALNEITDDSVDLLIKTMKQTPTLKKIDLEYNTFSESFKEKLLDAAKELQIDIILS